MSKEVYGCLWVFGCKSKATCPMKNRRCEGVVTVDLPLIYAPACLWVFTVLIGALGVYRCMGVYRCLRVFMGFRMSLGVYGFLWMSIFMDFHGFMD